MNFLLIGDKVYQSAQIDLPSDGIRSFLYGEIVYSSWSMTNGVTPGLDMHLDRLADGLVFLGVSFEEKDYYRRQMKNSIHKLKSFMEKSCSRFRKRNFYIRAHFYCNSPQVSFRRPDRQNVQCFLLAYEIPLNSGPVELVFSSRLRKEYPYQGLLKPLQFFQTQQDFKNHQIKNNQDLVYLDSQNEVIEASTSNLFFVHGDKFYTPKLSEKLINGVMRRLFMKFLGKYGFHLEEKKVRKEELNQFDYILLTNSVSILRIASFGNVNEIDQTKFLELNSLFRREIYGERENP